MPGRGDLSTDESGAVTVDYGESIYYRCRECSFVATEGEWREAGCTKVCPECQATGANRVSAFACETCETQYHVKNEALLCCTEEW